MTDFTIHELPIPESLQAPGGADFIEMTQLRNDIDAATLGNYDLSYTPAELLPHLHDRYRPHRLFVARVDGHMVGLAVYHAPSSPGSNEVWLEVDVVEHVRRRGIGSALYETLLNQAAEDKRSIIQGYVLHPHTGGDGVPALTGVGSVPLDTAQTRFVLSRGFRLEQVERMSRLTLPVDPALFSARLLEASAAAGSDYRLIRWGNRTPEQWLGDVAMMHQRMSTDAPSAGLELAEEPWDEDRVRTLDDLREAAPNAMLIVAVEHVPSGKLAGFTELSVPQEPTPQEPMPQEPRRPVSQLDTLVLREHRGHRLGLLLKLANLQHLADVAPGHPAVTTFNAEENRHMLNVNEAIGFVPAAYVGGWKLER